MPPATRPPGGFATPGRLRSAGWVRPSGGFAPPGQAAPPGQFAPGTLPGEPMPGGQFGAAQYGAARTDHPVNTACLVSTERPPAWSGRQPSVHWSESGPFPPGGFSPGSAGPGSAASGPTLSGRRHPARPRDRPPSSRARAVCRPARPGRRGTPRATKVDADGERVLTPTTIYAPGSLIVTPEGGENNPRGPAASGPPTPGPPAPDTADLDTTSPDTTGRVRRPRIRSAFYGPGPGTDPRPLRCPGAVRGCRVPARRRRRLPRSRRRPGRPGRSPTAVRWPARADTPVPGGYHGPGGQGPGQSAPGRICGARSRGPPRQRPRARVRAGARQRLYRRPPAQRHARIPVVTRIRRARHALRTRQFAARRAARPGRRPGPVGPVRHAKVSLVCSAPQGQAGPVRQAWPAGPYDAHQGQPTQFGVQGQPGQFNMQGPPGSYGPQGQPGPYGMQAPRSPYDGQGQPDQFGRPGGQPGVYGQQPQPGPYGPSGQQPQPGPYDPPGQQSQAGPSRARQWPPATRRRYGQQGPGGYPRPDAFAGPSGPGNSSGWNGEPGRAVPGWHRPRTAPERVPRLRVPR